MSSVQRACTEHVNQNLSELIQIVSILTNLFSIIIIITLQQNETKDRSKSYESEQEKAVMLINESHLYRRGPETCTIGSCWHVNLKRIGTLD